MNNLKPGDWVRVKHGRSDDSHRYHGRIFQIQNIHKVGPGFSDYVTLLNGISDSQQSGIWVDELEPALNRNIYFMEDYS